MAIARSPLILVEEPLKVCWPPQRCRRMVMHLSRNASAVRFNISVIRQYC